MTDNEQTGAENDVAKDKVPRATLEQKLQIIDEFHTLKRPQLDIVNKYRKTVSILTSSFSEWLKHEQDLRERFNRAGYPSQRRSRRRAKFKYEKINHAMDMMVQQRIDRNEPISEPILRGYWSIFAHQYGVEDPKRLVGFSHGWLAQFKQRHGLHKKRMSDLMLTPGEQGEEDDNKEDDNAQGNKSKDGHDDVKPMSAPKLSRMNSSSSSSSSSNVDVNYNNNNNNNVFRSSRTSSRDRSRDRVRSPHREPIAEQLKRKNNFELLQPQATEVMKPEIAISSSLLPESSAYSESERGNFTRLLHDSVQEFPSRSSDPSLLLPQRPLSTQSVTRNQFKPQLGLSFNSSSSNFHHSKSLTSLQRLGTPKQLLAQRQSHHNNSTTINNMKINNNGRPRHHPEHNSSISSTNEFTLQDYRQQAFSRSLIPDSNSDSHLNKLPAESLPLLEARTSSTTIGNTSTSSIAFLLGDSSETAPTTSSLEKSGSTVNENGFRFTNNNTSQKDRLVVSNDNKKNDGSLSVVSASEVERFIFVFADRFFLDYQYDYPQTMKLFQEFKNSFLNERIILERAQRDSNNNNNNNNNQENDKRYYEALPQVKRVKGSHGYTQLKVDMNIIQHQYPNNNDKQERYTNDNGNTESIARRLPDFQHRQSNNNVVNSGQLEDYILPGSPTGSIIGLNKNKLFSTAEPGSNNSGLVSSGDGGGSQSPSSTPSITNLTTTPSFLRFFDAGTTPSALSTPTVSSLNPVLSPVTTTPTMTEGKFIGLGGGAIRSPTTSQLPPPIRSFNTATNYNKCTNDNNGIMRLQDSSFKR